MYLATRRIEIDSAHRVTYHGSKCKNMHGHRYVIEATLRADQLPDAGEQRGMVLDFGFLKEIMVEQIDKPCDHGMIMWVDDPWLSYFVPDINVENIKDLVRNSASNCYEIPRSKFGKLYLMSTVPTAENLAEHWFNRLIQPCIDRSNGLGELAKVVVHETPNCKAEYHGR